MQWHPRLIEITASGNTATLDTTIRGLCRYISVVPPSAGDYDLEIYDPNGHYIVAETDLNGTARLLVDDALEGAFTIRLTNCPDGVYKFKISWKEL